MQPIKLFCGGEEVAAGTAKINFHTNENDEERAGLWKPKNYSFTATIKCDNKSELIEKLRKLFYSNRFSKAEVKRFIKVVERYGHVVFLQQCNAFFEERMVKSEAMIKCHTPRQVKLYVKKFKERCPVMLYDRNYLQITMKNHNKR